MENKLTFIKFTKPRYVPSGGKRIMGLFICKCGNEKEICVSTVKRNVTISCGCNGKAQIKKLGKMAGLWTKKHGMFGTRFYATYCNIKARCEDSKNISYKHYGAKGIKNEFKDFLSFKKYLYKSYLKHLKKFGQRNTTSGRIDGNKNYSAENCRWETYKEQANNRSNNRLLVYGGETKTLSQWCDKFGLTYKQTLKKLKLR